MPATPQEAKFCPGMKRNYSRPATPQLNQEGSKAMNERPRAQPLYNHLHHTIGQLWSSRRLNRAGMMWTDIIGRTTLHDGGWIEQGKMKALAQSSSFMLWGRQFIWCILATSPSHPQMHLTLLAYPIVHGGLKIGFIRNDEPAPGAGTWAEILHVFFKFMHQELSLFHGHFDEIDPI